MINTKKFIPLNLFGAFIKILSAMTLNIYKRGKNPADKARGVIDEVKGFFVSIEIDAPIRGFYILCMESLKLMDSYFFGSVWKLCKKTVCSLILKQGVFPKSPILLSKENKIANDKYYTN